MVRKILLFGTQTMAMLKVISQKIKQSCSFYKLKTSTLMMGMTYQSHCIV